MLFVDSVLRLLIILVSDHVLESLPISEAVGFQNSDGALPTHTCEHISERHKVSNKLSWIHTLPQFHGWHHHSPDYERLQSLDSTFSKSLYKISFLSCNWGNFAEKHNFALSK